MGRGGRGAGRRRRAARTTGPIGKTGSSLPYSGVFEGWIDPFRPPANPVPPNTIWRFIWHFVRQAKWALGANFLLDTVTGSMEALFFYFIGRLVDILGAGVAGEGWQGLIARNGGELLLILLFVVVFRFLAGFLQAMISNQVVGRGFYSLVDWQIYAHVARQSVGFFASEHSGSVLTKVAQAGNSLGNFITGALSSVWTILTFMVTSLILFAQLDLGLVVITIVWTVTVMGLARYFLPRLRDASIDLAEASAEMNGRVVDVYSNIQTVKLFGSTESADGYMREGVAGYVAATQRTGRLSVGMFSLMNLISGVALTAAAVLCIDLWTRGAISVGSIAFALALILRLNMWMGRLIGSINGLMRSFGVLQNSMELITRPISVVDAPDARDWTPAGGGIRFESVGFNYLAENTVIEKLDLDIAPGEKVGLVGYSGAGKTTIVNLLLRFYDVEFGPDSH